MVSPIKTIPGLITSEGAGGGAGHRQGDTFHTVLRGCRGPDILSCGMWRWPPSQCQEASIYVIPAHFHVGMQLQLRLFASTLIRAQRHMPQESSTCTAFSRSRSKRPERQGKAAEWSFLAHISGPKHPHSPPASLGVISIYAASAAKKLPAVPPSQGAPLHRRHAPNAHPGLDLPRAPDIPK